MIQRKQYLSRCGEGGCDYGRQAHSNGSFCFGFVLCRTIHRPSRARYAQAAREMLAGAPHKRGKIVLTV